MKITKKSANKNWGIQGFKILGLALLHLMGISLASSVKTDRAGLFPTAVILIVVAVLWMTIGIRHKKENGGWKFGSIVFTLCGIVAVVQLSVIIASQVMYQVNCPRRIAPNADLKYCNFSNRDYSSLDFHDADLTSANFESANLKYVDFRNAVLTNANFTDADISDAKLDGALLTGVNFTGATGLTDAQLGSVDIL